MAGRCGTPARKVSDYCQVVVRTGVSTRSEFEIPEVIDHALHGSGEMQAKGAVWKSERFGGRFVRFSRMQIRAFERQRESPIARFAIERGRGFPYERLQPGRRGIPRLTEKTGLQQRIADQLPRSIDRSKRIAYGGAELGFGKNQEWRRIGGGLWISPPQFLL